MKYFWVLTLLVLASCSACNSESSDENQIDTEVVNKPMVKVDANFNADSAYQFIAAQVNCGPRVPGTTGQQKCAAYLQQQLQSFTDTVYVQKTNVITGGGKSLPCINLIGAIHPQATTRFLLLAHWDTRPWADMDTDKKDQPIDGADDGASGVGVLLEIARQLQAHPLPAHVGVDILFVDVEDYGKTEWGEDSYCLGTQFWARNMHVPGYKAEWGILLDMVGAANAIFPMEGLSAMYAANVQNGLYAAANAAGYSSYFPFGVRNDLAVTDDHKYVNELARIPTVDVIHLTTHGGGTFPAHWHTHKDNMDIIDRATLKAVGQSVLQFIYQSAAQANPV